MIDEARLTLEPLLPLTVAEHSTLARCEKVIGRGLKTFVEVGQALSEIKESHLYRCEFPDFSSYCRERWKLGKAHAYRLIGAAELAQNLSPLGDGILPANEAQAREMLKYEPEAQRALWQIITGTAPEGKITSGHIRSVAVQLAETAFQCGMDDGSGEIKPIGKLLTANIIEETYERLKRQETYIADKGAGDEWFTADSPFLQAARRVLGGRIDLDPASTVAANKIIKAEKFYTKEENGLLHPWPGSVWLNAPFSFPLVQDFTQHAIEQYESGISKTILYLNNNSTGAVWCQSLLKRFPVCFPAGRVPFWRVGREGVGGARDDQMFTYLGHNEDVFIKEFGPLGTIVKAFGVNAG